MGQFGGYYKGEKKKPKRKKMDKKAQEVMNKKSFALPQVEIVGKKNNNW